MEWLVNLRGRSLSGSSPLCVKVISNTKRYRVGTSKHNNLLWCRVSKRGTTCFGPLLLVIYNFYWLLHTIVYSFSYIIVTLFIIYWLLHTIVYSFSYIIVTLFIIYWLLHTIVYSFSYIIFFTSFIQYCLVVILLVTPYYCL